MKTVTQFVTGLALTMTFAAAASAGEKDTVEFKYSPKAPVAETYENLRKRVKKICKDEAGVFAQYDLRHCMAEYTAQFVEAIDKPALTALHMRTENGDDRILLVENMRR